MENTVTLRLSDYDNLQKQINEQAKQIEEMAAVRITELKEIFQLDRSYDIITIYVDATKIIPELYGEQLKIKGITYKLDKAEITSQIYAVYKEAKDV